ncbi:Lactose transport system permease protein LacF [Candidatus Izimaplasma bacterium HR1]|jgi:multiple sugar transport system permease protein|uniref:carbohydrate ABC transporter permease n=1 Tax=Candidatus Izimoplasma sp. HR1 TaxID=1541959 RepID=UPI0004F79BA5|nr:Lactose transport system permease protein LacF [Candidatus Izimaplasma bacterium HR1]
MLERKSTLKAWMYLAPALTLLTVFTFYPLINAFLISFFGDVIIEDMSTSGFVGLQNYIDVVQNGNFQSALGNTAVIVFVSVPISIILALLISVGLKSIDKLQGVFQTIFFLPYVTNAIAIGMAFAFIFNQNYGLLNTILGWFGLAGEEGINWVGAGATWGRAMTSLLIYSIWGGLAFKILVFLSGLQSIDKQYYDAARIDAAPRGRIFTKITVPLLSPMIAYITITSFIGAFKVYTTVVGMFGPSMGTSGNPRQLITVVGMIYGYIGQIGQGGTAAAMAILLFLITLAFTGIQMQVSKRRVHF